MVRRGVLPVVVTLLLLSLAANVSAQGTVTGAVQGTIKDSQGAALPGVTVTAKSDVLVSGQQVAVTDERGIYRFPSLPPGAYTVAAELSGFQTLQQDNIRVRLGQSLVIDFVMPLSKVTDQITVTAEAPVVSVVDNTVSTNFDAGFLESQPLPRNYYALLASAPGVTLDPNSESGSSMMAYGGTGSTQNSYTLDGVNVADPADGNYWLLPSIQWMQEIQVSGLGANAEYGGYTGAVINGVTKAGGNEFHGGVELYYQPDSWVSNNTPADFGEQSPFSFHDYALSLGGPIVKDKIWYFISGEDWQQESSPVGAERSTVRSVPRYLGKITWQANPANRFMLMAENDGLVQDYRSISDLVLASGSYREESPNYTGALNWESLINPNNFINLKLTGFYGRLDELPYNGTSLPGRIDDGNTGYYWQNLDNTLLSTRHMLTFDGSWSLFADGLFAEKDAHSFKFGATYEQAAVTYQDTPNGGFTYWDDSSDCASTDYYFAHPECAVSSYAYKETGYGEYHEWLDTSAINLFAQDSMRLDKFTINYGARYGNYKGGFQAGHGNSDVYDVSFVDPRIGLVWDLVGNGKSAVKLHWGRYHQKMLGYMYDREISGNISPPVIDCYWNEDTTNYTDCETYSTPDLGVMGKYGHQYVDESLLTFEQQLGQETVIGVDFIDRKFRDIMAMINTNEDYVLINGTNPLTGAPIDIWRLNSAQEYVLTTENGDYGQPQAYRDYKSVVLRGEKRYSQGWYLSSSVVWTDLKGNQSNNYGYIDAFRDRNGFTNADGKIDMSYNEWDFKLNAAVNLPLNLQLSGQYNYLSGMYWTPYMRVTSGLNYNNLSGRAINLLPQGSEQLPDRNLLNLRVAWTPKFGAFKVTVSGEVFNVLNNSTMIDVNSRYAHYNAKKQTWSLRSNYGTAAAIEAPRQIRLGVRLEF
jgi:hypothetical protein